MKLPGIRALSDRLASSRSREAHTWIARAIAGSGRSGNGDWLEAERRACPLFRVPVLSRWLGDLRSTGSSGGTRRAKHGTRNPGVSRFRIEVGFACLIVVGGALSGNPSARADDVSLVPGAAIKQAIGGKVRGQILSESSAEVVVQVGGANVPVPVEQIASVRYDGQPASMALAESRESGGQLAEAIGLYQKAAADSANRPLLLRALQFREAEVLAELALTEPKYADEATEKLQKFASAYPNSRQIGDVRSALARTFLKKGDFAAADREIAELAKLPGASDRAAVLRTSVLAGQGKHDEALRELDQLIARLPKNSPGQRNAQFAKAQSLASMKKFDEAEALLREVIQANPPENATVQAPAYNTLGDCLREANRPKDALLAYLHTDLLYSKNKEEHPRALYQISQLFRKLKQDGRADEVFQRLKQEYPKSPWLAVGSKS